MRISSMKQISFKSKTQEPPKPKRLPPPPYQQCTCADCNGVVEAVKFKGYPEQLGHDFLRLNFFGDYNVTHDKCLIGVYRTLSYMAARNEAPKTKLDIGMERLAQFLEKRAKALETVENAVEKAVEKCK